MILPEYRHNLDKIQEKKSPDFLTRFAKKSGVSILFISNREKQNPGWQTILSSV
jgi:predicted secreted acid phosphatase